MSMIFQFRMLCDEDDYFLREYEVPYDMTLAAFRDFINKDLQYRPEELTSFFTADERWEKLREFTLMDMDDGSEGAPAAMESVTLGQIIHNNRDRLIYLFDLFGDRAYFLELTGTYEAGEVDLPVRRARRPGVFLGTDRGHEGGTGQALSGRNACRRRCSRPVSCRGGKRKRFRFRRRDGRFQRFRRHRRLWR